MTQNFKNYSAESHGCAKPCWCISISKPSHPFLNAFLCANWLTASSVDNFFSKSTEDERHTEGDLIYKADQATKKKHSHTRSLVSLSLFSLPQNHRSKFCKLHGSKYCIVHVNHLALHRFMWTLELLFVRKMLIWFIWTDLFVAFIKKNTLFR